MSISTLQKHPNANCSECPYLEIGKYVPPAFTSVPPELIVLGEAPGAHEARTGVPFTGASGKLLNQVLEHYNINPDSVIKQNTILCRPEGPTEKPPKKAIECCSNRLHKEIQESGAKTILAVGATAAHAVLDDNRKITELRIGPPRQYKFDSSIKVIPSVHPAFCLRSPDNFPTFVTDVEKIVKPPRSDWTPPNYRVFDNEEQTLIVLDRLDKVTDEIVIDIEVGIEKDFDYAHPEDYEMLCIGIAYAKGKAIVIGKNALSFQSVIDAIKWLFSRKKLYGHNLRFDMRGLSPLIGIHKQYGDTMLMSRSLDERPGQHGLKKLSVEVLGAPKYDEDIKKYIPSKGNYADVPKKVLYKYNAYDVVCTWDLKEYFKSKMDERAKKEHDFMVKASNELIYVELNGIHFDHEYNKELQLEYQIEIDRLENLLQKLIEKDINPRSPKQVLAQFLEFGHDLDTTNADFLKILQKQVKGITKEFIELLLQHRVVSKLMGTYIKGLARRTTHNKIYTNYSLHGTTSGRIASRRPNLQNISRNKKIRNQFTVEHHDNVLIQIDYSQIEGRTITALAQEEYLRDIFNDPERDIFNEFCNDIFGVGNWGKEERVKIKSVFYGNAYGRGTKSIADELEIPLSESNRLMSDFQSLVPKMSAWQESIKSHVLSGKDLITPFGRKRSFYLITNENKVDVINEALSFLPQSIASDICLSAMIILRPLLEGIAKIRLTVHDALVFECKEKDKEEVIRIASEVMVNCARKFTDYVDFAVDATVAKRLGDL